MSSLREYLIQKREALLTRRARAKSKGAGTARGSRPTSRPRAAAASGGAGSATSRSSATAPDFAGYNFGPGSAELQLGVLRELPDPHLPDPGRRSPGPAGRRSRSTSAASSTRAPTRPGFEDVPVYPHKIQYTVKISSPASDQELAAPHEAVERVWPILNLLVNPQQIAGTSRAERGAGTGAHRRVVAGGEPAGEAISSAPAARPPLGGRASGSTEARVPAGRVWEDLGPTLGLASICESRARAPKERAVDPTRFDAIARTVAARSRRQVIRALAGVVLGGLLGRVTTRPAAAELRPCNIDADCADLNGRCWNDGFCCAGAGVAAEDVSECCSGRIEDGVCACRRDQVFCGGQRCGRAKCCDGVCCPAMNLRRDRRLRSLLPPRSDLR